MKKKYIVTLMIIITGIMIYNMKNNRGEILKIEPNPEKGFSYEYYLYIPKGAAQSEIKYMLVEPNNGGRASDNHTDHVLDAKRLLLSKWCNKMAKALKTPLLVPVFDRPKSNWKMYTHDLDRDTLKNNEGKLSRIDLQLINMIKDAQEKLRDKGIVLEDKVFMHGFSASGSFVNRFAALHPRYVKAVASGGISYMPILPRDVWEEEKLIYPIGVYDIEEIADIQFNLSQYRDVAQYIYMGYMDDNDPLPYDDSYDEEERDLIKRFLGIPLMGRWEKSKEIYEALNIPAQFVIYNGVGHELKDEMIEDIIHFYQANNNEGIHYIQSYQYPFMEKHQLEKVHIKAAYWHDDSRLQGFNSLEENKFFILVEEWLEGEDNEQLSHFLGHLTNNSKKFILKADGEKDINCSISDRNLSNGKGTFQGYVVEIPEDQLSVMQANTPYTIHVHNEGETFLWVVRDDVTIVKTPS